MSESAARHVAMPAGLAISVGLVLDAFSDPLMGSLSDRTRSRLGHRHPCMLLAVVPLGLSVWGVYHPPEHWQGLWLWLSFWFALLVVSVRTFMTLFAWIGGAGTAWVARSYFFHATPEHPSGALNPAAYPAMATNTTNRPHP